jgi:hypothetical protein
MTDMKALVEQRIAEMGDKYLLAPANRVTRKTPPEKVRERDVAKHLKARVKELGGEWRKVRWEGRSHAPDILVLLPGTSCWVEAKRPGKEAEEGQAREHKRLWQSGQRVLVASTIEGVDDWFVSMGGKL